jgi:hypothetical protein
MSTPKKSSVVHPETGMPRNDQAKIPTYTVIIPILILCFFFLKSFIYIKDKKRHGK